MLIAIYYVPGSEPDPGARKRKGSFATQEGQSLDKTDKQANIYDPGNSKNESQQKNGTNVPQKCRKWH